MSSESIRKKFNPKDSIDWRNHNQKISLFFTVGEVTLRDDLRIPQDEQIEVNILALAAELDQARLEWGSPIGVTSWFRPPAINRAVGGVIDSQHLTGRAADIYTMDGRDQEFEDFLDQHWGGALGYGVSSGRGFTHVDLREGGWRRGPKLIRWRY